MISKEQIDRIQSEMSEAAREAVNRARQAELALENYSYPRTAFERRGFNPAERDKLVAEYVQADYLAESRSWISNLIRESKTKRGVPHDAVCFFRDGNQWCCVNGDFVNLQESPAGFGETFDEALSDLKKFLPHTHVAGDEDIDTCKRCGHDIRNEIHVRIAR